jgi:hypothetical protein
LLKFKNRGIEPLCQENSSKNNSLSLKRFPNFSLLILVLFMKVYAIRVMATGFSKQGTGYRIKKLLTPYDFG